MHLPWYRPYVSLLFLPDKPSAEWAFRLVLKVPSGKWGARNRKTKWGGVPASAAMNSVSQEALHGLRTHARKELSAIQLCIPECCSWATQLQCGKGLSTLEKPFSHSHCVKPPTIFHLSPDYNGIRREKGKDKMKKRMGLQYLTQRSHTCKQCTNVLFLSELY